MKLKFLGTGAADWCGRDARGEYRRFTSTLIDSSLLIDINSDVLALIPDISAVSDVFFTHSHKDHFDPDALKQLAPCRVYAHESWAGGISGAGLEVIPLRIGEPVSTPAGFSVTPLPSNHSTEDPGEITLHYLIEKDSRRVLYATDGAWLLAKEMNIIGSRVLSAAVFDATIGDGFDGDYRIFGHNSIDMIRFMLKTLRKTGRISEDTPVFLTHMARTLHGTQLEIEKKLEKPLIACYDGMERDI